MAIRPARRNQNRQGEGPQLVALVVEQQTEAKAMRRFGISIITLLLGFALAAAVSLASSSAQDTAEVSPVTRAAVWETETGQNSLVFNIDESLESSTDTVKVFKRITIRNLSENDAIYSITSKLKARTGVEFHDDAITISPVFPGKVRVGGGSERTVSIVMTVQLGLLMERRVADAIGERGDPDARRNGYSSLDPMLLKDVKGYLEINDGLHNPIRLPWRVTFGEESVGVLSE